MIYGARYGGGPRILTTKALADLVRTAPQDVVLTRTERHQYSGPLPLAPSVVVVGLPDETNPKELVTIIRKRDGSWSVSHP